VYGAIQFAKHYLYRAFNEKCARIRPGEGLFGMEDTNFVVYMYVREDGTPYYIGKGRPWRPYRRGGRPCVTPSRNRILILCKDISEKSALSIEKDLIAGYGRKDLDPVNGLLRNRSDGGEGTSNPSPERIKRLRERMTGERNPMYGKRGILSPIFGIKRTEEQRRRASEQKRGPNNSFYGKKGKEHNRYGIPHSQETLEKISKFYDWYHPNHGEILKVSTSRLPVMFPDQKLDRSSLCKVSNGICYHHKGWRLLKNKDVDICKELRKSRRKGSYNWHHKDYGDLKDLSCVELIAKFPELKLALSSLSKVSLGSQKAHRGWSIIITE
jgi:hypothetical protein